MFGFFGFLLLVGIASGGEKTAKVESGTWLHLSLDQPVPEQTGNVDIDPLSFSTKENIGLQDMIRCLDAAAKDDKVEGIFLDLDPAGIQAGMSTAKTLRRALADFKKSGKTVLAYSKSYSQGAYFMASVADTVYLNPMGSVDLVGFASVIPFFKEMLDKAGIRVQVFYAGDFKGATEPYRLTGLSEQNRRQIREYLEPVFQHFLADISTDRGVPAEALRRLADSLAIRNAKDALEHGLVDRIAYRDEVLQDLRTLQGIPEKENLRTTSIADYFSNIRKSRIGEGKERIAVVYAEGNIVDGAGGKGNIADGQYVRLLSQLRRDEKIKAVVLRVNSPGGSAMASENIAREISLLRESGKPVVASMGDYAASGGYYISCLANRIVATPNTLTGSIGVFSLIPNIAELMEDKLGVHWDTVKTAANSTGISPFFDLSATEESLMQQSTLEVYDIFLRRVSEGRGLSVDSVHAVAQGRVWTGERAVSLGLVDTLGDLQVAVDLAAELAGVSAYRLQQYPIQKDAIQELLEKMTGQDEDGVRNALFRRELGSFYPYYEHLQELLRQGQGVQARLPFVVPFR
jgi:protease-4